SCGTTGREAAEQNVGGDAGFIRGVGNNLAPAQWVDGFAAGRAQKPQIFLGQLLLLSEVVFAGLELATHLFPDVTESIRRAGDELFKFRCAVLDKIFVR